jgi:hypothetical protein
MIEHGDGPLGLYTFQESAHEKEIRSLDSVS